MPRISPLVVALPALISTLATRETSAADDLDRGIVVGGLDADDLADERAWIDPFVGRRGSLCVSLRLAVARWLAPLGPTLRMDAELALQLPLDRLLGTAGTPVSTWDGGRLDPALLGMGGAMKTKHARWGTLAALPGAIALGGIAAAKGKPTKWTPTTATTATAKGSTSASTSASVATPVAPSSTASTSAMPIVTTGSPPMVAGATVSASPPLLPVGTLRALVEAAWRTAGLDRDEALSDLASRARSSALAPEVRLRAQRSFTYGARIYGADALADRSTLTDGTETSVEARLTWRLDRLVFADEEVAIERVKLDRAELKQRVASRVVELTIAWTRARRAAANPDLLPQEREDAAMIALEAILALDAYTGGAATDLLRP